VRYDYKTVAPDARPNFDGDVFSLPKLVRGQILGIMGWALDAGWRSRYDEGLIYSYLLRTENIFDREKLIYIYQESTRYNDHMRIYRRSWKRELMKV
jgi:hypothetical protein